MEMKFKRPDTPLAATPEAKFQTAKDSIRPGRSWQQMSQEEKGAKKKELIKKGGIERFNQYKDSVSTEATGRKDAVLNKAASDAGMSPEKYQKFLRNRNSGPDAGLEGLMIGGSSKKSDTKSCGPKSPCKGGASIGINTKS